MVRAKRRERVALDARLDRRFRLGLGELLDASGQAVAAVPAGLRARLAEVADQRADLAAVVCDEREDVLDPGGLCALAACEAFEQVVDELGRRVRAGEQRVALAYLCRLQLDQAVLVQILERGQDPAALLPEPGRGVVGR